ncbi:iron uptake transporter permease EfeU [Neisseria chenwenguii]|uniref:iron uptake transporter permease EfeU n=1 Tax=Neisseria chenwenguii TaxID=1853278 RepID=UPI000F50A1A4|nr:iron uptake transporter permease EfeU [Neisseria chenwenguii]ROV56247.1 FTR1 family iron permease [Neisseria chenwenguii]
MFLIALLITLREGIEAALIVGIVAGFLKQSGYGRLMPKVWLGVALAALLCTAAGIGFFKTAGEIPQKQQEFLVGAIGLVAVGMLTYMILWMQKASHSLKAQLQQSVQAALRRGSGQGWALVLMAFLAVLREGLESVFFLLAVFTQSPSAAMPAGAVLGLLLAVAVGWLVYQGGVHLNLARFFRATGVLLIVIAAGLFAGAFRALHEAGVWNVWQVNPLDWSSTMPLDWSGVLHEDSPLGVLLGGFFGYTHHPVLSDFVLYFAYLLPVLFLFLRGSKPAEPSSSQTA